MVYFFKRDIPKRINAVILGFAAGVMIAASVWSLLIPSIEVAGDGWGVWSWVPAAVGFLLGGLFLVLLDHVLPHFHAGTGHEEGPHVKVHKSTRLFLAVTIHNIPEGMAVGVAYAAFIASPSGEALGGALALSIGIAIQNFPEGAIISMPLRAGGVSKSKAFLYGVLSGIVEPIGAAITLLMVSAILPILPFLLGFAAGAMIYAVVKELMPSVSERGEVGAIFFALGFSVMMVLDVAFG